MPFATTRWSLIMDARTDAPSARQALEQICRAYRRPVLEFVRMHGHTRADAEDLTQEFFARLLEGRWDRRADPERGRFRSFLLAALKHFLTNSTRATRAAKRGGGEVRVGLDDVEATLRSPDPRSPDQEFERAWAMTVVERAMARLGEEMTASGKGVLFEQLLPYIGESPDADDYRTLADRLGARPNTIAVAVHRLRARLRELVHAEVADQTEGPVAMARELRFLRSTLGRAGQGSNGPT